MFVKGHSYHEEKRRLSEEKREAKHRRREQKREDKRRRREEKREEKNRHREAKNRLREEFRNGLINQFTQFLNPPSTSETTQHDDFIVGHSNFNERPERMEQDVATIRTIFPDCDPEYIRNCLIREQIDDRVRKVTEKLLTTVYPKVAPVSPSTLPTAPPLPVRSSCELPFNDEPPPSYEESLGQGQFLQPPPLPKRHHRSSSWNGTSVTSGQSTRQTRQTQQTQFSNSPSSEMVDAIGATVKNLLTSFKPSTVEQAFNKYNYIWTRPVPSNLRLKPLSQQFKVSSKDKHSIQRGFSPNNYPSRELREYHNVSDEDWYLFISGLNSIIGVNSINGSSSNLGDEYSVSLKWVSWLKVTMDDKLMESNITAISEYLTKWNDSFFIPRQIMIQFVDDKSPTNTSSNHFHCKYKEKKYSFKQYLLVKSI